MSDKQRADIYLELASESLAGAHSEYAAGRFNNCANRAYYAAFQAAIAALLREAIRGRDNHWAHTFVQSEFVGKLNLRHHRYPSTLQSSLARLETMRIRADYHGEWISESDASRSLRRSREFVEAIRLTGEKSNDT